MRSVEELVSEVVADLGGVSASPLGRERVIKKMGYAWEEIYTALDLGTADGLPALRFRTSVTVTLSGTDSTELAIANLRQIDEIAEAAADGSPRTLLKIGFSDIPTRIRDLTNAGNTYLECYAITGQDRATGYWQVYFWPRPTGSHVLEVYGSRNGSTLVDSPIYANRVEIPDGYEELLILGTKKRLVSERKNAKRDAILEFDAMLERLRQGTVARGNKQEKVRWGTERSIETGQPRPNRLDRNYRNNWRG